MPAAAVAGCVEVVSGCGDLAGPVSVITTSLPCRIWLSGRDGKEVICLACPPTGSLIVTLAVCGAGLVSSFMPDFTNSESENVFGIMHEPIADSVLL